MNCLAIDTSSDFLSLALSYQGGVSLRHEPAGQAHAERALPAIEQLLSEANAKLSDLDAIVYGQGPGSFTGLRIACGLAQGLAFAADLRVVAIPTLDCVAAQVSGKVLVCLDARMGQVYWAAYDSRDGRQLAPITLSNPEAVVLPDSDQNWIAAGNGFSAYVALLTTRLAPQCCSLQPELRPHAATLITLADSGRYPMMAARDANLLYVRDKVALTNREQQAQRK